jgi:hypothetical protein
VDFSPVARFDRIYVTRMNAKVIFSPISFGLTANKHICKNKHFLSDHVGVLTSLELCSVDWSCPFLSIFNEEVDFAVPKNNIFHRDAASIRRA